MHQYLITTKRLGLRRWLERDIEPFAKMNMDTEVMEFFPRTYQYQETLAMVERINASFEKNSFGLYAVEDKLTMEFMGFTGFAIPRFQSFFTPCIEIGWRYKKDVWGKGFATEAATACLDYGFKTLHFEKVVSFTAKINLRSEKVMKRIGMTYVGNFNHPELEKHTSLCDHILYEVIRP